MTIAQIKELTFMSGFGGFPVVDTDGSLMGIITGRDVRFVTDLEHVGA